MDEWGFPIRPFFSFVELAKSQFSKNKKQFRKTRN